MSPENVDVIVKASLVLHNYLQSMTTGTVTDVTRMENDNIQPEESMENTDNSALLVREQFKNYFCTEGSVEWQRNYAMRGYELV